MFGKVIEFLTDRFFDSDRDRPRVAISLKPGEARAEPDPEAPATRVRATWNLKLALANESQTPAADLKLVWPREPLFHAALPYYLGTFEEKVVPIRVQKTLPREPVFGSLPPELDEASFVLTYRDLRGGYFHTCYTRRGEQESSEFREKLPEVP